MRGSNRVRDVKEVRNLLTFAEALFSLCFGELDLSFFPFKNNIMTNLKRFIHIEAIWSIGMAGANCSR